MLTNIGAYVDATWLTLWHGDSPHFTLKSYQQWPSDPGRAGKLYYCCYTESRWFDSRFRWLRATQHWLRQHP